MNLKYKKLNLLTATGNVVAHDKINDYFIYSKNNLR